MNANSSASKSVGIHEVESLILTRIRSVLLHHGRLGTDAMQLAENDDLYAAGMTSLASVNVMLALENEFNIEFPDQMLNRSMFSSIGAIEAALRKASRA